MDQLEKLGKKRTLLIALAILLISIHTIYYYHVIRPGFDVQKFITQIIRFTLTIGLLVMIYKGKHWAKVLGLILFTLGVLGAIIGLCIGPLMTVNTLPLVVMILVYAMAIYHFGFSKSFKAFSTYQNKRRG